MLKSYDKASDGRVIHQLPKPEGMRGNELMLGVGKCRNTQLRDALFLGTGRCGTTFTEKVMKYAGLDVLHERTGANGTVSQLYYVDADWYPAAPWTNGKRHVGERRSDFTFGTVFHIVRDPLKSIPSMTGIYGSLLWEFHRQHGMTPAEPLPPLARAAHLWVNLNKECERQALLTLRVELYENNWETVLSLLNHPLKPWPNFAPVNRASGFRKRPPVTLKQIADVAGSAVAKDVAKLAHHYGYEV